VNTRRKLIVALSAGAVAVAVPFSSFGQQQGKVWRIGFLWENEPSSYIARIDAFKAGLLELGYTEGKNYTIEHRAAKNDPSRLPELAELLSLKVDLIIVTGTPSAAAARNITRVIPILMTTVGDPVGGGLVASLRRPGGNITGLTNLSAELTTKQLDLLRQILPNMRRVGYLYNPGNAANVANLRQLEADCSKLQIKSIRAPVQKEQDVETAFNALQHDKAQGVIVSGDNSINSWRKIIVENAMKHQLPTICSSSALVETGALISYYANYLDTYRRAAGYADKIFKGAKPGDLPVEQPVKFEMIINLKTAKALGIKIPDVVMLRADRVIE
jgi:putative ABC transport system substrate-binding protein